MKQTLLNFNVVSEFNCVEALIWFLLHIIGERNYEEIWFQDLFGDFKGVLGLDKQLLVLQQLIRLLFHPAAISPLGPLDQLKRLIQVFEDYL